MLRVHGHHGQAVFFGERGGHGVKVVADDLHHAGGDQKHRLRVVFLHHFGKRRLDFLCAAERYVVPIQGHGHAAAVQAAEVFRLHAEMLGVIGALVGADDEHQRVRYAAHGHGRAHQRAVGAGEHGRRERTHVLDRLHAPQALHPREQLVSIHVFSSRVVFAKR